MSISGVIKLLRSKNRCLERMRALSESFLLELERGSFEGLQKFEDQRDEILRAMDLFERKITSEVAALDRSHVSKGDIDLVEACLAEKRAIIQEIFVADQKVIVAIENERARIDAAISGTAKDQSKMAKMAKFKSTWVPEAGEGLDEKL